MKKIIIILLALWPAIAWSASHGGEHAAEHHAVNWTELALQSITFLIFAGGLFYFARKPAAKFFLGRHEAVKNAVMEAKKAVEEANAKAREYAQKMQALDQELAALKTTFEGQAKAEKERMLADADAAAKKVQRDAEQSIAAELSKAQEHLRAEAADLAVKLAEDILRREIKPEDQKRLVDDFMKTLTQNTKQKAA